MKKSKRSGEYSAETVLRFDQTKTLNARELGIVSENKEGCFIPLCAEQGVSSLTLRYKTADCLALSLYLVQTVLTKKLFVGMMNDILNLKKAVEAEHLNLCLVDFDMDVVCVNRNDGSLRFRYIPIQPFGTTKTIGKTVAEIASFAVFDSSEDTGYLNDFKRVLTGKDTFSVLEMERFIRKNTDNSDGNAGRTLLFGKRLSTFEKIESFPAQIGKSEESDFVINDPTVSRKHALIRRVDGRFYVEDVGSTNGTFIGGERLAPGQWYPLFDGTEICFSKEEYVVMIKEN